MHKLILLFALQVLYSCKASKEIDIYFIDKNGKETTQTFFSSRPFVSYKPKFEELSDGSYQRVGMEIIDKMYGYMGVRAVIDNTSNQDYTLLKVKFSGQGYGPHGTVPLSFEGVTSGCDFEEKNCQFCYPRRIKANSQELIQVSKGPIRDFGCYWGLKDENVYLVAARINMEIEVHSEEHGRLKMILEMFAEPKEGYSPLESGSFGYLFCSDGKHINEPNCGGPWEWGDPPGSGEWAHCNCDDLCVCDEEDE